MKRTIIFLLAAFSVAVTGQINAASLVLLSSDPALDQVGTAPDLTGMMFVLDKA